MLPSLSTVMPDTRLLCLGPEAAAPLAALHAGCFPGDPWSPEAFATLLAEEQGLALAVVEKDGLLAFLLLRQVLDEAEVLSLGVDPASRRNGFGRLLVESGCALLRSRRAKRLFLEVAAGNAAARRLYAGLGFRQAGLRKGYYPDGEDALVLCLDLSSS